MKNILIIVISLFLIAPSLNAQPRKGQALASKVLYYDSSGLKSQSAEILGSISDSTCRAFSYSQRHTVCFEGVFYQVGVSQKFETGIEKTVFRKSTNGINWTGLVKVGDAPEGKREYGTNIYVWRKNGTVHIGVTHSDHRTTNPQMRFVLSTDAGITFQPSVQIGNNTNNQDLLYNGGLTGIGDTIVASWTYRRPPSIYGGTTYYAITSTGGTSWLPMGTSHTGGAHSKLTDVMLDENNKIYIATCQWTGSGKNIEIRSTTNLGTNWIANTSITNQSSNNANDMVHLRYYNNKFYAVWVHWFWGVALYDRVFISKSTNAGLNWQTPVRINDPDTIIYCTSLPTTPLDNIHPTLAFSPTGNIYAVWADSRERQSPNYDSLHMNVYISRSTDDGVTWSPDLKINSGSNIPTISNETSCVNIKSDGVIDTVLITYTKVRDVNILPITHLDLTLFIEGFYNAVSNSMVQDTLWVYLHNNFSPYSIVDSSVSYLSSIGQATFTFTNAAEGVNYYIRTKHRNALETWSKSPGQSFSSSYLSYDFTPADSQAFGSNMKQVDTSPLKFAIYSGDVDTNRDGVIDGSDASIVDNDAYNFVTGYVVSDVTGDEVTDGSDAAIVDNNAYNFVTKATP